MSQKTVGDVEPASYILMLSSADGLMESSQSQTTTSWTNKVDSSIVVLNVSQPLPTGRLWESQVLAFDCGVHSITDSFELSKLSTSLQ